MGTKYFDKQKKKKKTEKVLPESLPKFARILPEYCPNDAQSLPELITVWKKIGGGGTVPPAPPPPPLRLIRLWSSLISELQIYDSMLW